MADRAQLLWDNDSVTVGESTQRGARQLGEYQLVAEIAQGGMGIVYLALKGGLAGFSKVLVVKQLKREFSEDNSFVEMFLEEARLAARLTHKNIVTTYEVAMDGGRPFIVMEYLEGQSLARVLRKGGNRISLAMVLRVLVAALHGLDYAHTRESVDGNADSVIHRDISPENIFITYDGQVKVVDFGIAKASDSRIETRAGTLKGKAMYMAPEQLRGDADTRSDVFSMGVILWEAITKQRMWFKRSDVVVLTALLKQEIPSIDEAAPDAPAELRRIVSKAIAPDLSDRYQTARAMTEDLERYLASIGDQTTLHAVGSAVAEVFAENRQRVRRLIEQAIQELKAATPSSLPMRKLPSIAPPSDDESTSRSAQALPFGTALMSGAPPRTSSGTSSSMATPGGAAMSVGEPAGRERAPRWPLVLAVLFFVVCGLGFLGRTFLGRSSTDTSASAVVPDAGAASGSTATVPAHPDAVSPAAEATPSAVGSAAKAASPPATRIIYVPVPVHTAAPVPKSAPTTTGAAPGPATVPTAHLDCNPPFYFDGTKKVFKPGCL